MIIPIFLLGTLLTMIYLVCIHSSLKQNNVTPVLQDGIVEKTLGCNNAMLNLVHSVPNLPLREKNTVNKYITN